MRAFVWLRTRRWLPAAIAAIVVLLWAAGLFGTWSHVALWVAVLMPCVVAVGVWRVELPSSTWPIFFALILVTLAVMAAIQFVG